LRSRLCSSWAASWYYSGVVWFNKSGVVICIKKPKGHFAIHRHFLNIKTMRERIADKAKIIAENRMEEIG